ncbi:hypothetical protein D9M71_492950 [compost metagenome]
MPLEHGLASLDRPGFRVSVEYPEHALALDDQAHVVQVFALEPTGHGAGLRGPALKTRGQLFKDVGHAQLVVGVNGTERRQLWQAEQIT